MTCTCTFGYRHMQAEFSVMRPQRIRLFVPAQMAMNSFNQQTEEARQSWRLACFDSNEVMTLEKSRTAFPFLHKKAIHEFAHLLRQPDPKTIPVLEPFKNVIGSTRDSPIQNLPLEITTMILSQLCDFDALNLALSGRYFFNVCAYRVQNMLDHRTSGGWIGKRLAVVGEQAYTPGFITYEPKIHGTDTGMLVPSRDSKAGNILDSLFVRFQNRKFGTGKQIIEPGEEVDLALHPEIRYERRRRLTGIVASGRYPENINDIVRFLLMGSTKTSGDATSVGRRGSIIRNLRKRHYIHTSKGESFKRYLRKAAAHKQAFEESDAARFTADEAAICAFAMEVMWGGSGKEGGWTATDCFDIVEESRWDLDEANMEGWEDVSDDVIQGAIVAFQRVY